MKKLLVLISLILCVSMLFAACAKDGGQENVQPEENVEANIDKVITELNKGETLEDILGTVKTTVDYEQLVAELKKVSAKGAIDLTATEDGEDVGTVTGSFAIKDNVLHAEANNGEETVGIDASISDAYKLVMATWGYEDGEDLDVFEALAFDIAAIYDEMMAQVEEGMEEEMPIDLSEIKLPEFTEEHLKYEDGKYILDKQFLYDSIVATAEAIIDAAKEEGVITEDMDIDTQIADIKEKAQKVVDVVDLEIYFVVKSEVIEGMGVSVNVKSADLAKALEADAEDMGFDYIKANVEATLTGSKASLEYKELEDSHINKMSYDVKFLFDGEAICGVDMKYDIDTKTTSHSEHKSDDEYGYWSKYEHTSITKQSATLKFDLSKFDDANATVLDASIKVDSENSSVNEHGSNYDETVKNESSSTNDMEITMTVKTTEANKADIAMSGNSHYTYTTTDEDYEDEDTSSTVGLHGTIEFTTKDVTVPAPDADVKDAMDDAEVITSVMGGGVVAPEESPKDPNYGYEDSVVTPMPEETTGW